MQFFTLRHNVHAGKEPDARRHMLLFLVSEVHLQSKVTRFMCCANVHVYITRPAVLNIYETAVGHQAHPEAITYCVYMYMSSLNNHSGDGILYFKCILVLRNIDCWVRRQHTYRHTQGIHSSLGAELKTYVLIDTYRIDSQCSGLHMFANSNSCGIRY